MQNVCIHKSSLLNYIISVDVFIKKCFIQQFSLIFADKNNWIIIECEKCENSKLFKNLKNNLSMTFY